MNSGIEMLSLNRGHLLQTPSDAVDLRTSVRPLSAGHKKGCSGLTGLLLKNPVTAIDLGSYAGVRPEACERTA